MSLRIVIMGGGASGLLTGELLGRAGHDVTVVERDAAAPPDDDEGAWESWDRPGTNQLRQPHGVLGYGLATLHSEIPDLMLSLDRTDSVVVDTHKQSPEGTTVAPDRPVTILGVRRTTFDRRLAATVALGQNIDVRSGVEATGLVVATPYTTGLPRVSGIQTTSGTIDAELVIDASGRRTPVPVYLKGLGIRYEESRESDGFTYFTRWFRSQRSLSDEPIGFGGIAPGLIALRFPADGQAFAVAMAASAKDRPIRRLRDPNVFMEVARAFPAIVSLVSDAEPITSVIPMGSIQNRHLRFGDSEGPTVQGLIPVADSAISTNPSLGRGISLALRFAVGIRDILASEPNQVEFAHEYDRTFRTEHLPWLTDSIDSDVYLRNLFRTTTRGEPPPRPERPRDILATAAPFDPEIWGRWAEVWHCHRDPTSATSDTGLLDRAKVIAAGVPPPQFTISRERLESLLLG